MSPAEIAELIGRGRYDLTTEKACQADIETLLAASLPLGCALYREHRLGPYDIPDFLIATGEMSVVVEVKLRGAQPRAVLRQLGRYAIYRDVGALILVSNKAMSFPAAIEGKPVLFVSLGRAWL